MQTASTLKLRASGCLWGIFIGDSLSMPVHWFYNRTHITQLFGYIETYQDCPSSHPTSILNLSSTGTGGRGMVSIVSRVTVLGDQNGNIVGDVILKGKKHLWGQPNMHYHHGISR
jgi:ADP-ribosylglycohydrolase